MSLYNKYSKIIVNREGELEDSHMKTLKILSEIQSEKCYQINYNSIDEIEPDENIKQLSHQCEHHVSLPVHTTFKDTILKDNLNANKNLNSNILGQNYTLLLNETELNIPVAETTPENLAYYGAILLQVGDKVNFNHSVDLPVTKMNIGKNYVKGFLLNEELGGGCYLEYHNTPHFHMPLNENSSGYLILSKVTNQGCHLSAFKIPFGYAIYTKPLAIHCDAYLNGDYLVVYTVTDTYLTLLLKTKINKMPVDVKVV